MGDYLEHDLDHSPPTKFFLPPLPEPGFARRTIPRKPSPPAPSTQADAEASTSTSPALAAAIERRRRVYSDNLYARHVAANEWTGYRRTLTPRDVVSDRERALAFLERELRVWAPPHDVPRLAQHLVKLLSAIDVRSSAAVRMLEPLVGDTYPHAAEHLVHELAAFLRSPFPLDVWDDVVQYGNGDETYPETRRGRGRSRSRSVSVSDRSDSRSRSRSRPRNGDRSQSRSRSRSRSRPRSPRDASPRDSFRPRSRSRSRSPPARRWDQADSWVDPEFRTSRRGGRRERERREMQNGRDDSRKGQELLDRLGPSQPQPQPQPQAFHRAVAGAGIVIRGAAERRQSLLERLDRERLARAKAEEGQGSGQEASAAGQEQGGAAQASADQSPASASETASPASNGHAAGGNRAAELREKLMAERKTRQLREQLLARKRARNAIAEAAEDVKTRARRKSEAGGVEGAVKEGQSSTPTQETQSASPANDSPSDAAPAASDAPKGADDAAPAPAASDAPDSVAQET